MFESPFYIRRRMSFFAKAVNKRKHVTIGFIGGSITDPRERCRWSEYVVSDFISEHPDVTVDVENAAIGATGSEYAVMRVDEDIISRNCDIVFVEFAVNDMQMSADMRNACREGLLRRLLKNTSADIVLTYTYMEEMLPDMLRHVLPDSVAEFEKMAEYYGISSVFMSSYALDAVHKGTLRWEEWLPDGLHPANTGSRFYAEPVTGFLHEVLDAPAQECVSGRDVLPAPMFPDNWEFAERFPLSEVSRYGYWRKYRCLDRPLVSCVLSSTCPGSSLSWSFEGTGTVIVLNYGRMSADFRVRIDGGEWKNVHPDRRIWMDNYSWLRPMVLCDHLEYACHTAEVAVLPPEHITELQQGTTFEISCIEILK